MLAEATFSNETPRGWQEVTLSSPVSVTAGTTYVATYHTTVGNYAWNSGFFASSGVDNGPLRALANGEDGGNGVYAYGPSRSFPNSSWQSTQLLGGRGLPGQRRRSRHHPADDHDPGSPGRGRAR